MANAATELPEFDYEPAADVDSPTYVLDSFVKTRVRELRAAWLSRDEAKERVWTAWRSFGERVSPELGAWLYAIMASSASQTPQRRAVAPPPPRPVAFEADEPPDALVDDFRLRRELIGRVRDIDRQAGEFLALLNERGASEEHEVAGRFPLSLLSDADQRRLTVGMGFNLVTGYRRVRTTSGETLKASLETRLLLRRSPPLSAALLEAARERARQLRAGQA
jgi:hypothetical protein